MEPAEYIEKYWQYSILLYFLNNRQMKPVMHYIQLLWLYVGSFCKQISKYNKLGKLKP